MEEGEEWGVSSRSGGDGHGLRNPPPPPHPFVFLLEVAQFGMT